MSDSKDDKDACVTALAASVAKVRLATEAAVQLLEAPPATEFDLRSCLSRPSKGNEWEHFPAVKCRDTSDEEFAAFVMSPDTQQRINTALVESCRYHSKRWKARLRLCCAVSRVGARRLDHVFVLLLGAHTTVGSAHAEGGWPLPIEVILTSHGGAKRPYRFFHCKTNEKQKGSAYERVVPIILDQAAAAECTMEVLLKICSPRLINKAVFADVARHFKDVLGLPFKSHEKDTTNLSRQLLATRMWHILQRREHVDLRRLSPRGLTAWINVILGHRRRSRDWAAYVYSVQAM